MSLCRVFFRLPPLRKRGTGARIGISTADRMPESAAVAYGAVVARVVNASDVANGKGVSLGTTTWEIDGKVSGRASTSQQQMFLSEADVPCRP